MTIDRMIKASIFVFTLIGLAFSASASMNQKASAFVLCKNKKDVRTIRVLSDGAREGQKDSCTITYSKGGVDEIVGSNRSLNTCMSILKNIQFNLESSKWSCRNVASAEIMTGTEVQGGSEVKSQ